MAPIPPKNSINHFTHPGHQLTPLDGADYLCDGCRTTGSGRKFRCSHGCDFDLHEYCATCPLQLIASTMHPAHALTLVMRKPDGSRRLDRVCDVCSDPVEGLFYRCKECEFDVHPLCTQLPDLLSHALHAVHPLHLSSPGNPSFCAVCRGTCDGWRYTCRGCNFDIHLECVLVPVVVPAVTRQRGVPRRYGNGNIPNFGPGGNGNFFNPYNNGDQMNYYYYNNYNYNYPGFINYYQQVGGNGNGNGSTGKKRKSMFALVGQLGFGVISNMVFGVDLTSLFTG
ncbi:uncharacterized protein LOC127251050 [Andrographis paniculata]|uniref:uncharacterized protein LOC127251050 n=1 Tax=Andrographis paniculata TaxID=175694 RepID=UPI0021E7A620|nr:uncharacterized protein LOC127251050 [Andrographis paniculata]